MASGGDPEYGSMQKNWPEGSRMFKPGKRQRFNLVPVLLNFLIPWFLFCSLYAVMCFEYHYFYESKCMMLVVAGFLFSFFIGYLAYTKKGRDRDPMWYMFCAICCFLACLSAFIAGDFVYNRYLLPFYEIENLNTYPSVNPGVETGSQMLDAGKIYFGEGTGLDMRRSMSFRNGALYCVAPIVSGDVPLKTYDFWAVGENCCSSVAADYRCGQYDNPYARSGLRMMTDSKRYYYHLAVKQAEAAFGIKATRPLFFHWVQDPIKELNKYKIDGRKAYIIGIGMHGGIQFFAVVVACVFFSRIGKI